MIVSLYKVVNSSLDGESKSIESVGQKHCWFESSKTTLLLMIASDRRKSRLKASLNNFVPALHPRQVPLTRYTTLKGIRELFVGVRELFVEEALLLVCSFRRNGTAPIAAVKFVPSVNTPMIFTSSTILNNGSQEP